ncbi:undecaprenyl-phosphate glucose phosphotransferase [Blastochloris sulfoviridis]|uniref:Undecaprenyl-phosphate glucose phosphotransferase n=1 Tax=Blastochloris sulfoviridis TaxID=50712 RepID=A0A5M6HUN6_9HYPH|nr:undecaprenyl-phosphate glucose phosphotransferase [Blastochloris sulfoviridis]KAA5599572.1 undecaprenyl-phosphate glucose phosphotransferase [Blastochloris sulfoviridis]
MLDANLRGEPENCPVAPSSPAASTPAAKPRLTAVARRLAAEPIAAAVSPIVLAGFVRLVEFTAIALLGAAIYLAYVVPNDGFAAYYPVAILTLTGAAVLAFQAVDIYHVQAFRSVSAQFSRLAAAWTLVFLVAFAVAFFARIEDAFSRVWIGSWYVSGLMTLLALRIGLASLVRTWTQEGRLVRRTVIVGGGEAGEKLIKSLEAQPDSDLDIVGVFDDRSDRRSPGQVGDKLKLGSVADLVEFARRTRIDLVVFSLPVSAETRILDMLKKLWVLPVDIRLSAHSAKLRFRPRAYSYIGNVPTLDVFDRPLADWDVVMKWLFDKIVGSLALLALSPVMLLVAIAVKLDSPGPVLFRQKRYGFNNELIEVFKFRSMYTDTCDATAARLVTKGDPRVTRVGRILRKTSLDELPQLFNVVFAGNLSLVGPRPHAVHAKAENRLYDEAVDGYFARHRVKPGITGWAQINGWRGETDTEEKLQRRVEHDLYYIENWSVLFDLAILLKTPFALFKTENAY